MIQVGYQLLNTETGEVVRSWGGPKSIVLIAPNPVILPNGDTVFSADVDTDYSGYTLVKWMMPAPAPQIPQQVPMWSVRVVLHQNNLIDQAQAAIDASGDYAIQSVWEYGNFADRNSPAIVMLSNELGMTSQEVDEMFLAAAAIIV